MFDPSHIPTNEELRAEKLHLEPFRVAVVTYTSMRLIERGYHADVAHMGTQIDLQFRNYVEPIEHRIALKTTAVLPAARRILDGENVPIDWWQHLRWRWFPKWWLARHPVITRTIARVEMRVCPHRAIRDPEHGDHLVFLRNSEVV